jgi:hypothetical protein
MSLFGTGQFLDLFSDHSVDIRIVETGSSFKKLCHDFGGSYVSLRSLELQDEYRKRKVRFLPRQVEKQIIRRLDRQSKSKILPIN